MPEDISKDQRAFLEREEQRYSPQSRAAAFRRGRRMYPPRVAMTGSAGTPINLVSSLNPVVIGNSVTFTATLPQGTTGTIQFFDSSTQIGTTQTLTGSPPQASVSTSALIMGPHIITARYSGDATHPASTSSTLLQQVSGNPTTITLGTPSPASPQTFGTAITFPATVTGGGTGTVTFFADGAQIGTPQTISAGTATLSGFTGLSVGTHSITARYDGDATHAQSTSPAISYTINQATTSTALTAVPNPVNPNSSVTFTATVTPSAATGTVTFTNNTAVASLLEGTPGDILLDGTDQLTDELPTGLAGDLGTVMLSGGVATLTVPAGFPAGSYSITASYNGSTNYASSMSAPLTLTVEVVTLAYYSTPRGLYYPTLEFPGSNSNANVLDIAGEQMAYIGRVYIDGRPAGTKTLSAAGGGSIGFPLGAITFTDPGTTVQIGLQNVSTTAGLVAQPTESFDVSRTLTGGGGGLTASAWNTISMTGGSGTKAVAHGDTIAVVISMTARGGTDTIATQAGNIFLGTQAGFPTTNAKVSGVWQTAMANGAVRVPVTLITFDDGTLAVLDGAVPAASVTQDVYSTSTPPNERGLQFQLPWSCKIDAVWINVACGAATADFNIKLYDVSTPATPAPVTGFTTMNMLAEQTSVANTANFSVWPLPSEVQLNRGTDYVLSVENTTAVSVRVAMANFPDANVRKFVPGGTTLFKATRNGGTGTFTTTDTTIALMGVRISQLQS
jgi:hypothetical protein